MQEEWTKQRGPVDMDQPWSCDACGARGMTRHRSDQDAGVITAKARAEHALCPGPLRFSERVLVRRLTGNLQTADVA